MRIGTGFDVHRYGDGNEITVGGVAIPHSRGVIAHSDGDVLVHALADALLGAIAAGDIGKHFPDTEEKWRGADSRSLLKQVFQLIQDAGYRIENADMTLIAERPKFSPYIDTMRENIAEDLGADIQAISVKATTTEKMGFTGREEGIAAQATVLLSSVN